MNKFETCLTFQTLNYEAYPSSSTEVNPPAFKLTATTKTNVPPC